MLVTVITCEVSRGGGAIPVMTASGKIVPHRKNRVPPASRLSPFRRGAPSAWCTWARWAGWRSWSSPAASHPRRYWRSGGRRFYRRGGGVASPWLCGWALDECSPGAEGRRASGRVYCRWGVPLRVWAVLDGGADLREKNARRRRTRHRGGRAGWRSVCPVAIVFDGIEARLSAGRSADVPAVLTCSRMACCADVLCCRRPVAGGVDRIPTATTKGPRGSVWRTQ